MVNTHSLNWLSHSSICSPTVNSSICMSDIPDMLKKASGCWVCNLVPLMITGSGTTLGWIYCKHNDTWGLSGTWSQSHCHQLHILPTDRSSLSLFHRRLFVVYSVLYCIITELSVGSGLQFENTGVFRCTLGRFNCRYFSLLLHLYHFSWF